MTTPRWSFRWFDEGGGVDNVVDGGGYDDVDVDPWLHQFSHSIELNKKQSDVIYIIL